MAETYQIQAVKECAFNEPKNVKFGGEMIYLCGVHPSSGEGVQYFDMRPSTAAATALCSTPFESASSSTSIELWSIQIGLLLVEHVQQPTPSPLLDVLGQYLCTHPINSFAKNMLKAYLGSSQTAASSGSIDGQM
jgi:hypothetical protein